MRVILAIAYLAAIVIPDIWYFFQFVGSTSITCLAFVFPGAIVLRDAHGISTGRDMITGHKPSVRCVNAVVDWQQQSGYLVCTGVMMHGYDLVGKLCTELKDFMKMHNFSSIEEFRGMSLQYFTTHTELVRIQKEAIQKKKAMKKGLASDKDWTGDGFVKESESMVSN